MRSDKILSLSESFSLAQIGQVSTKNIILAFTRKLAETGNSDIDVEVAIDREEGIAVNFSDSEGDNIVILFRSDEEDESEAIVITGDDDQITIDLSPVDPPFIIDPTGQQFLDLTNLDWMNKTTLNALLKAGRVGLGEAIYGVMHGDRIVKLPVIRRTRMSADQLKRLRDKIRFGTGWSNI